MKFPFFLIKKRFLLFSLLSSLIQPTKAQQTNTLYFMEDVSVRHILNPAFQATTQYYISLPVLGYLHAGYNNNSFSLSNLDNLSLTSLYNKLKINTLIAADFQTNFLSIGYAVNNSFFNFTLAQKVDINTTFPKDIFKFMIYGTPDLLANHYSISALAVNANVYTEAAFGFSQQIDEQWMLGVKLKFLGGNSNIDYSNVLNLSANVDNWNLKGNADLRYAGPVQITFDHLSENPDVEIPKKITDWFSYQGAGAGIDIGVQFRMLQNLYLSASLTDVGFIRWKTNILNKKIELDYNFDGFTHLNSGMTAEEVSTQFNNLVTGNDLMDSLITAIKNSTTLNSYTGQYNSYTTAKISMAAEYKFLSGRLNFGLLYRAVLNDKFRSNELTASLNGKPSDWLSTSVSYSLINGCNAFGCGIGIKTGIFHWYAALDCLPLSYSMISVSDFRLPFPYHQTSVNFSTGISIVFGERIRKSDYFTNQPFNPQTGLYKPKFKKQKCNWDHSCPNF
ncbi:MAG: DUF5723 family protein [Paludibacter sp.]|nr:DUF5723 family protein [Paludibacter sp.]